MSFTRRAYIKSSVACALGITISPALLALEDDLNVSSNVCIFSKCLQFLTYSQMADAIVELGFEGVDLTVRKNGHVSPEKVQADLPQVAIEFQKVGKSISMIATDIVDPNCPITENILSTASELGIKYYRMGRLKYNRSKSILQNLDDHKHTLEKIDKLNRKYKMHGCIQNHSGPYNMVGAPVWDFYSILKDFDPEFLGVQYDIMHATAEGGFSWHLGLELIAPWVKTIDIKDFIWEKNESGKWKFKIVPLDMGMVDFTKFFEEIKRLGIHADYSIHYEYDLGGAEFGKLHPKIHPNNIYKMIERDLYVFRSMIQRG